MDPPLAQLKVQELLAEVRVDYEELQPAVEAAVAAVKDVVMQIPEQEVLRSLAKGLLKDLGVPRKKSSLVFKRPESVTIVGSYSTRTMAKPIQSVDVALRIPKGCFYEKDFLNHRYHAKRALYLALIQKYLHLCPTFKTIEWAFLQQDARKPMLLLHPVSGVFVLHVITTISDDVFSAPKLAPNRNNVRDVKIKDGSPQPTPHYNESILEDMFVEERNDVESRMLCQSGSLQEAILLLKVWLRQRTFHNYPDSLNGFLLSMLILHLNSAAGGQRITKQMTALQIFRITLEMIATYDVLGKGTKLQLDGAGKQSVLKNQGKLCLSKKGEPMLMDTFGSANLAFRMTRSALEEVKNAAMHTLAAMKVSSLDSGFDESFMTTVDFAAKFDYHISVTSADALAPPIFLDDGIWRIYEGRIEKLLMRCLGERATLVRVLRRSLASGWSPKKALSEFLDPRVSVGVLLSNFETAFRTVDVGPSADHKEESARFRSFWGKKSELRRFKDGTISETVAWECEVWQRHLIIPQIVEYILSRHLSIAARNIDTVSGNLDFALLDKGQDPIVRMPKVLEALDTFSKRLRVLDLPLKVSSVQPLSSAFRHAAVFLPRPHRSASGVRELPRQPVGTCLEPLEVMIQLEGSGRWPNDPAAVQKTKMAFCLKIADSMQKQWRTPSIVSEDAVDILMDGFAFRISIYYEKDRTLVKHKGGAINKNPASAVSTSDDLILRSMHSSMLYGLQGIYPAYGATVRLAKRWVAAHLFSAVLSEEAIELLVAYLFVRPGPMSPPCTRITGFMRFLRLLACYDWNMSSLIVDINGDLSLKDRESIMAHFETTRKGQHSELYEGLANGPAMFIATPYDMESLTWTRTSPSKLDLKRLAAYAKSSATLLLNNVTGKDNRWQSLFRTPLNFYNAVIRLQKQSLPYPGRVLFPVELDTEATVVCPSSARPLALQLDEVERRLMIGFNPILEFVRELQGKFGDVLDIWYDSLGSDVIGLTLKKPASSNPEVVGYKRKRTENGQHTNLKFMLEEIASLGRDFVKSIHLRGV